MLARHNLVALRHDQPQRFKNRSRGLVKTFRKCPQQQQCIALKVTTKKSRRVLCQGCLLPFYLNISIFASFCRAFAVEFEKAYNFVIQTWTTANSSQLSCAPPRSTPEIQKSFQTFNENVSEVSTAAAVHRIEGSQYNTRRVLCQARLSVTFIKV